MEQLQHILVYFPEEFPFAPVFAVFTLGEGYCEGGGGIGRPRSFITICKSFQVSFF
jgi:hypothetical protein